MADKIKALDWAAVRQDVRRFVRVAEYPSLELWGRELFLGQWQKIGG